VSSEVQNGVPNVVTIIPNASVFSTSSPGVLRCGSEERSPNFFAASIEFDAMAPIVLVHGWNAGPWVWGPTPAQSNVCPGKSQKASDSGQNFIQALIDAKAPYDCSIQFNRQDWNDVGAQKLSDQLSPILKSFGTRHVNLVAHSKGGLFAREFLQKNATKSDPTTRIGVVSLTTLDTPHYGSVLADTVAIFKAGFFTRPIDLALRAAHFEPGFLGRGALDMTTGAAEKFNQDYKSPPDHFDLKDSNGNSFVTKPSYYSTSADADQDGNGVISDTEAAPFRPVFARLLYNIMAHGHSVAVTEFGGLLNADLSSLNGDYARNDFIVSVSSARYPKFDEINSYTGPDGRNHQTMRCGQGGQAAPVCSGHTDVAQAVLQKIRDAERNQPAQ
jgi:pimeloyl-ACP methyl ester carboxylesterase